MLRMLAHGPIRHQLTGAVTFGVFWIAFASTLASSWHATKRIQEVFVSQGLRATSQLAAHSVLSLLYESPDNASDAIATVFRLPGVVRVEIRHVSGAALVAEGKGGRIRVVVDPQVIVGQLADEAVLETETDEQWQFLAAVRTQGEDSPFAVHTRSAEVMGYVRVVQSKSELRSLILDVFVTNFAMLLAFAFMFAAVIGFLARVLTKSLTALSLVMNRAEHGEMSVRAKVEGPSDIARMATAFNSMMTVIDDRDREMRVLLVRHRRLAGHMDAMRESQNRRIALELHDSIGGNLTMIKLGLAMVLEDKSLPSSLAAEVEDIRRIADATLHQSKDITLGLRPAMLDTLGPSKAIQVYVEGWSHQTRLETHMHMNADPRPGKGAAMALFRTVQEALTNVVRHARASHVSITLDMIDGEIFLCIADNGCGFVVGNQVTHGFGLLGMRERIEYFNGSVTIMSSPGNGVTITVRMPLCSPGDGDAQ